ncbi:MAG TPA: DUF167 domain-containing protein [Chloroflexota bacterium]|nr:DUF167 domain-containing protein [Chloroflexota bacterium]
MERVRVHVRPSARRTAVVGYQEGILRIDLNAPPIDNRANDELVKLLARELGIARGRVSVRHGQTSRQKLVEIDASVDVVAAWLASYRAKEHPSGQKR